MLYAPCALLFWASRGFHADAKDIMAEMEGFGKGSQLFVTSEMVKVLLPLLNGACRADRQTGATGARILDRGGIDHQGKIGENSDQANPRSKFFIDEKVVSANPSQPCGSCNMFVGKGAFLGFSVHNLRGGEGRGPRFEAMTR